MRQPFSRVSGTTHSVLSWFSSRTPSLKNRAALPALALAFISGGDAAAQSKIATTITLAVSTSAGSTTSVPSGTVVTLAATVTPASGSIGAGQVNFCDSTASHCTDIHLLGTAQVTSGGKATLKLRPGIGSHTYKASFAGTATNAGSTSASSSPLAVTGKFSSTTTIAQAGVVGAYTLTATVAGDPSIVSAADPTGTVSFVDASYSNQVLTTVNLGTATRGLSFFNASNPATVPEPNVAAAADFNGDGIVDLAVSNSNSGATNLTILLGKGDGTFSPTPTSPTVGLYPDGIAIADFNSDGVADLAVTSVDQNEVIILLGNGDGTFNAGPILPTSATPQSIATADFDGDGLADLAVVNGSNASIFLGKGDGTFKPSITVASVGSSPVGLGVGDFNRDGIPDLAVVDTLQSAPVRMFLGNGDGTFTAGANYAITGDSPVGICVGDFNSDGFLDLAVTNYSNASRDAIAILLGNGDGSFKTPVFYAGSGLSYRTVAIADFNGDGIPDLVAAQFWSGPGSIFIGNGNGTFQTAAPIAASVPFSSGYVAVADYNGDGIPDLALPNQDVSGTIAILLTQNTRTVNTELANPTLTGPAPHNVKASYPGDNNYLASESTTTTLDVQVATPVLSVPAGIYTTAQTLTITDATPGAEIYYYSYGIINTPGYVRYTGPIALAQGGSLFIEVYATETGYQNSNPVYANYSLNFPATATPSISQPGGYYAGAQSVTITDSDPAAKIYYTTNGSVPSTSSNLYTGPVTVSSSQTIVAAALSYGRAFSPVVEAQYLIGGSPVSLIYSIGGTGVQGYTGNGGPATLAQTFYISGLARDAAGNFYFSDEASHVVRKIAAGTGTLTVLAGNEYNGNSGDGGPATSAELGSPSLLAIDGSGLYIADLSNLNIRRVDLNSGTISTYAGNGTGSASGNGGPATAAGIGYIKGLAFDSSHNLFLTDYFSVREINASTGIITGLTPTYFGYAGDGGPVSSATFRTPLGITFDAAGNLYIADAGNELIRKVTAVGGVITPSSIVSTVAGTPPAQNAYPSGGYSGDGGPATSAALNNPNALAVDGAGNLYISDEYNSVVRKVDATTGIISTAVGNGSRCSFQNGDGGAASSSALCFPLAMIIDGTGDIFLADNDRVREVVPAALPPSTPAATPTFSVQGGTYATPQTVTISDSTPGASIYVTLDGSAPTSNNSIGYSVPLEVMGKVTLKAVAVAPGYAISAPASQTYNVTAPAPVIRTIAGTGDYATSLSGTPALNLNFFSVQGIAIDAAGNLYVSDSTACRVWKIDAATGVGSIYAGSGICSYYGDGGPATLANLYAPEGLAFDSAGNLYIAETATGVIRKITTSTGVISTVAGTYQASSNSDIGDGGPATSAHLSNPASIAFDGADNLYIGDTYHYRVRKVLASTGVISTVAGNGTAASTGDGGPATSAGLDQPFAIALDSANNIYIGDNSGGKIRKVSSATGLISTIAGIKDLSGEIGDGGPATNAEVNARALTIGPDGNLFISNGPGEIRELNLSTGVVSRVAGIGLPGYSGDGGAAAVAQLYYPNQIAFDKAGNLYVADSMLRVREVFAVTKPTATPTFSVPSGTYAGPQTITISDATPNATIYYTTDGTAPTTTSSIYSSPITVSASETIEAIAVATGYTQSAAATATYVISVVPPAPGIASLSPAYISAGSGQFTLSVKGSAFTNGSTVFWGASALATQYVDATQLIATVPAANVASAGVASVNVQIPTGPTSNTLQFEIDSPGSNTPPSFLPSAATATAGSTATYSVTLPSGATNVTVNCLNLPAGSSCSYSSGTLSITTSSSTPKGTFLITVVFSETLPGAAALILFPLLLAPLCRGRGRRRSSILFFGALFMTGLIILGCGGGGGSSGGDSNPPPQTHQVTSSGTVTLTVK
ncbi:FG-GAP-like repeat-containing protein [Occallatibacter savannae]|uniref:FG-GAP-like repeat-containing protein n=1 Tax=Occallatibacter savannae TaxID=1002691 RepID=UPI000D691AF4|nr:FG-GAP-like repeat-containing protein [Occallatibacter savannae]